MEPINLTETMNEMRESIQSYASTDNMRLSFLINNVGDVTIQECCVRMTGLRIIENRSTPFVGDLRPENKLLKWVNSDKEFVKLGLYSFQHLTLARVVRQGIAPYFYFVVFGIDNPSSATPRNEVGRWETVIQIEGQAENNSMKIELIPIEFTILFEFAGGQLRPLEVYKHERE